MFVQFSDSSEAEVVSVFLNPQDKTIYPNQGEIDEDDERYIKFIAAPVEEPPVDPVEKLKKFLSENPDVAAILS